MKKVIMMASAAVLALALNSCGSDDSGSGVSETKLAGKWNYSTQKFSAAGQTTGEVEYEGNQEGCSTKDYIQFNADNTFAERDYYGSDCAFDTNNGTWTLSGKTLTADGESYTVKSVSATTLKLEQRFTEGNIDFVDLYTFTKVAE